MTTIVVVRKGDTAVIAADTLTTFGTTRLAPAYDRHPQKITQYGDSSRLACHGSHGVRCCLVSR